MTKLTYPENSKGSIQRLMRETGASAEEAYAMMLMASILTDLSPEDDEVIALCIDGKALSSVAFAQLLSEAERSGRRQVFVIGGSLGLAPEVVRRADRKLSFSPMTFPHQLARVMLLEQVYRGCKINAGEKYHK